MKRLGLLGPVMGFLITSATFARDRIRLAAEQRGGLDSTTHALGQIIAFFKTYAK